MYMATERGGVGKYNQNSDSNRLGDRKKSAES